MRLVWHDCWFLSCYCVPIFGGSYSSFCRGSPCIFFFSRGPIMCVHVLSNIVCSMVVLPKESSGSPGQKSVSPPIHPWPLVQDYMPIIWFKCLFIYRFHAGLWYPPLTTYPHQLWWSDSMEFLWGQAGHWRNLRLGWYLKGSPTTSAPAMRVERCWVWLESWTILNPYRTS